MVKLSVNLQGISYKEGEQITADSKVYLPEFDGDLLEEVTITESPNGWLSDFKLTWDFRGLPSLGKVVTFNTRIMKTSNAAGSIKLVSTEGEIDVIDQGFKTDDTLHFPLTIKGAIPYPNKRITILPGLRIRFDDVYEYLGGPKGVQSLDQKCQVLLGHKNEQPGAFYKSDIADIRNEIIESLEGLPDGSTIKYNKDKKLEAINSGGGGIPSVAHDLTLDGDGTSDNKLKVVAKNLADGTTIVEKNNVLSAVSAAAPEVFHDTTLDGKGTSDNRLKIVAKSIADGTTIVENNNILSAVNTGVTEVFHDTTLDGKGTSTDKLSLTYIEKSENNTYIRLKAKSENGEAYLNNSTSSMSIFSRLNLWNSTGGDSFLQINRNVGETDSTLSTLNLKAINWTSTADSFIPTVGDIKKLPDNNTIKINTSGKLEVIGGGSGGGGITEVIHDDTLSGKGTSTEKLSIPYIETSTTNNTVKIKAKSNYWESCLYAETNDDSANIKLNLWNGGIGDTFIRLYRQARVRELKGILSTQGLSEIDWKSNTNNTYIPTIGDIRNMIDNETIIFNKNGKLEAVSIDQEYEPDGLTIVLNTKSQLSVNLDGDTILNVLGDTPKTSSGIDGTSLILNKDGKLAVAIDEDTIISTDTENTEKQIKSKKYEPDGKTVVLNKDGKLALNLDSSSILSSVFDLEYLRKKLLSLETEMNFIKEQLYECQS